MSRYETLMARDGHTFQAYLASPAGHSRGGVVIVQGIFGLTAAILRAADRYAAEGYLAVAPALFDRVRRGLVLGYSPQEIQEARGYRQQVDIAKAMLDLAAAAAITRHAGRIALIGYGWGALLTWLAASRIPLAAAVCFYGAQIAEHLQAHPACPVMLHFGERDESIPLSEVERLRTAFPRGIYYLYDAGQGFCNEDRPERYDAAASALARTRTDAFLAQNVG